MRDDLDGDEGAADARIERQIKLIAELDQTGRYGEGRAARELLALMTEVRDQLRRARHLRAKVKRTWTDVCSNFEAVTREARTDPSQAIP